MSFSTPFTRKSEAIDIPDQFDFEKEFNFGLRQSVMNRFGLRREVLGSLVAQHFQNTQDKKDNTSND